MQYIVCRVNKSIYQINMLRVQIRVCVLKVLNAPNLKEFQPRKSLLWEVQ